MQRTSRNPEETKALAKEWIQAYPELRLILLTGELGTGKTTFVKGVAENFGIEPNAIKSPTFTLKENHTAFCHYDLYRLETEDPMILEQIEEDLADGKRVLIEWPERLSALALKPALHIQFKHISENERSMELILPL